MCLKLSKRIMILTLVLCVTVVQVLTPPKKVNAMGADIVIGGGAAVIATETALAWLLGTLGFTATSAVIYENRDALMEWGGEKIDDFGEFCEDAYEEFQITASDAKEWLEQLAKGTMDKASAAFSAFKSWAFASSQAPSADITEIIDVNYDISQAEIVRKYSNYIDKGGVLTWNNNQKYFEGYQNIIRSQYTLGHSANVPITAIQVLGTDSQDETYKDYYDRYEYGCALQDFTFHTYFMPGGYSNGYTLTNPWMDTPNIVQVGDYSVYVTDSLYATSGWINTDKGIDALRSGLIGEWISLNVGYYGRINANEAFLKYAAMAYLDYMGLLEDGFFVSGEAQLEVNEKTQAIIDRDGTIDNIDILSPTGVAEGVIELPWDKVGTLAPDGTYDLPLDHTGTLVTDIPVVIPVDTTTDKTLDTDVPLEDAITVPGTAVDTSGIKDYTMIGLEKFFPFCLPFDFINFLKVLDAEPETPRFEWEMTFLEDLGFEPYTFVIDLSAFNSVATICRNLELFAFIVGLIIATRSRFIRG